MISNLAKNVADELVKRGVHASTIKEQFGRTVEGWEIPHTRSNFGSNARRVPGGSTYTFLTSAGELIQVTRDLSQDHTTGFSFSSPDYSSDRLQWLQVCLEYLQTHYD